MAELKHPEGAPKILRIGIIQNGKIVEERLVRKRENVTIDNVTNSTGGPFVLQGTGVPFTTVRIQAAATPSPAAFTPLVSVPVGGDGTFAYTDASGISPRFYRVQYP